MLRGFGDVGATTFTAEQSFTAILGSSTAAVFGGGVEVVLPQRIFVNVRASRFRQTGQRVFLSGGEQFDLGIPTTVTLTPLQVTAATVSLASSGSPRMRAPASGWYHFTETSQFADTSENVDEQFSGFHVLGGAEVRLVRWLSLGWRAAVGDRAGCDRRAIRTASLASSTSPTWAARRSASRSSSGM